MKEKIGIIGFGNMGSAIAERLKAQVAVFDKDNLKTRNLKGGIKVMLSAASVLEESDVIIIAVKPQDVSSLLDTIKKPAKGANKLFISIAAGITTGYIEKALSNARVIRAMPNVGAKIGKSVTCICKGNFATQEDLEVARGIFSRIGEVQELNEDMMDAATAISGSGPAYYFYAIETNFDKYRNSHQQFQQDFMVALSKAAGAIGFDEKTAQFLANWTVVYSDLLLKETGLAPQDLRKQVTSKGGTTEAALEVLSRGGSLAEAVKSAVKRAKELAKGE